MLDQTEALARQHRAEQSLRDSEARKTAILQSAVDAIITIDDRGLVESVNPATERIFGYAADVMVGQNINLLMPYPDRGDHDRYLDDYLTTAPEKLLGIGRELIGRRSDGSRFPVELTVRKIQLGDRWIFTGFARDITERKQSALRLMLAGELQGAQPRAWSQQPGPRRFRLDGRRRPQGTHACNP